MYLSGLDELDRKILDLLTQNARYSYSELGERLGLSRVAIKNRMDALEQRGVIEGYTVIVNPQRANGAISCYYEIEARPDALEQRGVIEGYTVIVNPQRANGAISCYYEIEARPDALAEVVRLLDACPTVTQIYRMTGECRLHVHAVAASQDELEQLTTQVLDRLPGVLSLRTNVILKRIKDIKGLRL